MNNLEKAMNALSSNKFKIGTRVKIKQHGFIIKYGEKGTICDIEHIDESESIGVNWDKKDNFKHECHGNCQDHHGYYVPKNELTIIK